MCVMIPAAGPSSGKVQSVLKVSLFSLFFLFFFITAVSPARSAATNQTNLVTALGRVLVRVPDYSYRGETNEEGM